MSTLAKMVIQLEAQSAQVTKAIDDGRKELKTFGNDVKEQIEGIKGYFGRGSAIEEGMKVLRGAGAVMGLNEAAKAFGEMGKKAAELSQQFREGKTDAAGIALGIAESLPIIGHIVQGIEGISEAITGTKAAAAALLETHKRDAEALKDQLEFQRQMKELQEGTSQKLEGIQAKLDDLQLPEALRKPHQIIVEAKVQDEKAKSELEKQIQAAQDKYTNALRNNESLKKYFADQHKDMNLGAMSGDQIEKQLFADQHLTPKQLVGQQAGPGYDADRAMAGAKARIDEMRNAMKFLDFGGIVQAGGQRDVAVAELQSDYNLTTDAAKKLSTEMTRQARINAFGPLMDQINPLKLAMGSIADPQSLREHAEHARQTVHGILDNLKTQVAETKAKLSGLPSSTADIDKLKAAGASPEDIANAQKMLDTMKGMEDRAAARKKQTDEWVKSQDEAKRLIESTQTPLQKWQEQQQKINQLQADGFLTAAQARQALAHNAKEFIGQDQTDKRAGAESRVYNFSGPKDSTHAASKQDQAMALQKQLTESAKRQEYYQQQMYQYAKDAADDGSEFFTI